MAHFRIISAVAESLGLAIRLQQHEGHKVSMFINSKDEGDVGDGIVEKVKNWDDDADSVDLWFFDDCRQKHRGEPTYKSDEWSQKLRDEGKLVVGGGHADVSKLENDRIYGAKILEDYGSSFPILERFTDFEEAKKFLEKNGGSWALKHENQVDRDASTVGTAKKVIKFINYLKENWSEVGNNEPVKFVLQPKATGLEIAATAFFDGEKFRKEAIYLNRERKKELCGDLGRSTGQMGEIGIMKNNPKLFSESLAKIEQFLIEKGYCGFIDLNCIVNKGNIVPLEFTARPGYPTFYSFMNMLNEPIGKWLIRMAKKDEKPIKVHPGYNCTLVVASASFPDQDDKKAKSCVIDLPNEKENIWLCEIRKTEDGEYRGAGTMGYLAVITTKGPTIKRSADAAREIAKSIEVIPYEIYRIDIGELEAKEFPELEKMGWFNENKFNTNYKGVAS